jgi:GNAT superfamily N-acetyltransferase
MLGAWVAETNGGVGGHIALRAGTAEAHACVWSEATGLPAERLTSVTRFFVPPEVRGAGIGGALLDAACTDAAARSLHPALEVVETDHDAVSLYERRGRQRVHSERWAAARDSETLLHHYVAPPATSSRAASPEA